jgi:dipeptidyl aminopeptidase/acylaminoacyl peptidase
MRLGDGKRYLRKAGTYFRQSRYNSNVVQPESDATRIFNLDSGDSVVIAGARQLELFEKDQYLIYLKDGALFYGKIFGKKQVLCKGVNDFTVSDKGQGTFLQGGKLFSFSLPQSKVKLLIDFDQLAPPAGFELLRKAYQARGGQTDFIFELVAKTAKKTPVSSSEKSAEPQVNLELWTWNEPISQRLQRKGATRKQQPKRPVFIYHKNNKSWSEIPKEYYGRTQLPPSGGDIRYAFLNDPSPYTIMLDWRYANNADLYSLDLSTGKRRLQVKDSYTLPQWSPNGRYALLYDAKGKTWKAFDIATGGFRDISSQIGFPLYQQDHDMPRPAEPYGLAGWMADGNTAVIYDRYDLWSVELSGGGHISCLTGGYGRKNRIRLRLLGADYCEKIDPAVPILLRSFNENTKSRGLYKFTDRSGVHPLIDQENYDIKIISQSANGNFLFSKENFSTYPDLWWANADFSRQQQITNINPQQKKFWWGTAKLINYKTIDGKDNQGIVYLPEGYKPGKSYPAVVDFYETHTENLHEYFTPGYSTATIDIPTYLSNGYIVFRPDVHFEIGHPGESAYNCVVSGTRYLIDKGMIDPAHVALQGHSWSGYEAAYILTRTPMFTCANTGAAVVNMTYNYFAIRANGSPNMFKYEVEQSRMGKNLWEDQDGYIQNSPIFRMDSIKTPLLIFHNDGDGAVPFSQGLDFFLSMRRLQKPAWLLNYKREGHTLAAKSTQQDWTHRMRQFFDHYLKDAPMPKWMSEGISIDEQGITDKFETQ